MKLSKLPVIRLEVCHSGCPFCGHTGIFHAQMFGQGIRFRHRIKREPE